MVTTRVRGAPLTRYLLLVLALMLVPFPATPGLASPSAQPDCETFSVPGIKNKVCGPFAVYWRANGGLAQQGYPITGGVSEINQQDGKAYTVQYFERAVFELHPEIPTDNKVLLSLLGAFFYRSRYPEGAPGQRPNTTSGSELFPQTGKRVGGRFLQYWRANGGLAQQGLPISDEFSEKSLTDDKTYTVQYFERAVFEYHPIGDTVLLSLLGVFRLRSALVQPYDAGDYKGWVCHSKGSDDPRCVQIGANGPSTSIPSEVAQDGPPPWATLAQPGDVLLSNSNGTLPVRYAVHDVRLMKASKVGLWPRSPCTGSNSISLLAGEVLVEDETVPFQFSAGKVCIDPKGTTYGARVWPDGSVDVAVSRGALGAAVIDPTGGSRVIFPGQQVHASPAGVVGTPGPIDEEFAKNFARYTGPDKPPPPTPTREPGWATSLLSNGDFETGSLAPWTTQIDGGSVTIVTRPVRTGTYSVMVTSVAKGVGVTGGGTCPGGNRVAVIPNTPYTWAGWIFIPESERPPSANVSVYWYTGCSGENAITTSAIQWVEDTGKWSRSSTGGYSPSNALYASVALVLIPANNTASSAYFDDVQLNQAGAPLTPTPTPFPIP